jgi:pimeloyl-ACP methyl ester carboxylesterase
MGKDRNRPSDYRPLLEFNLRRARESGRLRVPGQLIGDLEQQARRTCLVLVHGFNNAAGEAEAAYLRFRISEAEVFSRGDPAAWDRYFGDAFWPGDADYWSIFDYLDFLVYPSAVKTAVKAAQELASLLWQMPNLAQVDFVAHSLGARVTLETLLLLRQRSAPVVGRVCLMAAAVPAEMIEPGGRFYALLDELEAEGTTVHVLHSTHDAVLQFAFAPGQALAGWGEGSARALGRHGPTPAMPGFGAALTESAVPGAGHGDYWGGQRQPQRFAARNAGVYLHLGDVAREVGTERIVGVGSDPIPERELGADREIGN